jgi:proteasome accessory factor C
VDAWSGTAGDMRRFRVDRISEAQSIGTDAAGTPGSAPSDGDSASVDVASMSGAAPQPGDRGFAVFVPGPDNRRVRLFLDRASTWLVESIPSAGPPEPVADGVEVEVFVGGTAWLERLLLRLGPGARVVEPPEDRGLSGDAARRILRRYGVADEVATASAAVEGGSPD